MALRAAVANGDSSCHLKIPYLTGRFGASTHQCVVFLCRTSNCNSCITILIQKRPGSCERPGCGAGPATVRSAARNAFPRRQVSRYEPNLNPTCHDLAEHYGVAVLPAPTAPRTGPRWKTRAGSHGLGAGPLWQQRFLSLKLSSTGRCATCWPRWTGWPCAPERGGPHSRLTITY